MSTLTRLQPGMVIELSGVRHRVILVNESRALCVPVDRKREVYEVHVGRDAGKRIEILKQRDPVSISPNSECEILEWANTTRSAGCVHQEGRES